MRRILFTLLAIFGIMSVNAQVIKIKQGNTLVATYTADEADEVVFTDSKTGTAMRTGDIPVKWIQLWENGPKFAEYNVGSEVMWDIGAYYAWGGWEPGSSNRNNGDAVLSGDNDTATRLWGSNWRMPTKEELQQLLDNCNIEQATVNNVRGLRYRGKVPPYTVNSIFLPETNRRYDGDYWSSTPSQPNWAWALEGTDGMDTEPRANVNPVRAVLAE